jgi:signal peptidase I
MAQQANSPGSGGQEKTTGQARAYAAGMYDIIKVVIHALILALLVRTFLYQPFNIPSGSMKETLLIGDYLFVSKFSYGYSRYSFPIDLSFIHGRIWEGEGPERGDIAVFRPPREPGTDYIKRVIGLPGDRIQVLDGILHINGTPVPRERVDEVQVQGDYGNVRTVTRYRETLPNGVSYITWDAGTTLLDNTEVYVVPEGHFFMMGDNRDNSQDSRVWDSVGPVPLENFIGRAEIIFFSTDRSASIYEIWKWPTAIRWGRLFQLVY